MPKTNTLIMRPFKYGAAKNIGEMEGNMKYAPTKTRTKTKTIKNVCLVGWLNSKFFDFLKDLLDVTV